MRVLVLGGTRFVGRHLVGEALSRGDEVTALTRGRSGPLPDGVRALRADRRDLAAVTEAIGGQQWDAVLDTWSGEPRVVAESARLLAGRVDYYGYVSSRSVYAWPIPEAADERAPLVDADPESTDTVGYAAAKRGAELAVTAAYGQRCLLARAGLILGPYEDVGRLPWWLHRIARGGRVVAPGPRDRALQYVDARDLAAFMRRAAERRIAGAFNVVSEPGHTTIGELLECCVRLTGSDAELVWVSPGRLAAAGVTGWTDLPIWVPPTGDLAGLHSGDVSAALAAGLTCRPIAETVADTWAWLHDADRTGGGPAGGRAGELGIDAGTERRLLRG
ncbi:MAG: NAD-dependent epimerase/dehydratase family protein [Nocardioidaceae bacterium]